MRLRKGECEVCGRAAECVSPPDPQARRPRETLGRDSPDGRLMAKRRRKTLVACAECHHAIHAEHIAALLTA